MKRKVYQDGNGSGLIMIDGLGEYVPREDYEKVIEEKEKLLKIAEGFADYAERYVGVIKGSLLEKTISQVKSLTNKGE